MGLTTTKGEIGEAMVLADDATTERCYYVPSAVWGGLARPGLRLAPTSNGQRRGIRWADEFLVPEHRDVSSERLELLDTLGCPPE